MTLASEELFTVEQVAAAVGMSTRRVTSLSRLGILESAAHDPERFRATAVIRLRRMLRLRSEVGVNLLGAAIILDLVDRLDRAHLDLARAHQRPYERGNV